MARDQKNSEKTPPKGLITRTALEACQDAATRPTPNKLAGSLFYEGEICFLFAETGAGKSILAVQIGEALARGQSLSRFLPNEAHLLKVLYMDFELTDGQFLIRYQNPDTKEIYQFSDRLLRSELSPDADPPEDMTWDEFIQAIFENEINEHRPDVLILDNVTALESDGEKAKKAGPLMKRLKQIKSKYNLSMLLIGHVPKRDHSRPITRNDLGGSKMFINFADSAFSIGESAKDSGIRYIKQIKVRNTAFEFDAGNVITCQIDKADNFTGFEFMGLTDEKEHLKEYKDNELSDLEARALELLSEVDSSGKKNTVRKVAEILGLSSSKVFRIKQKNEEAPF